ncbi:phosphoribosylaminoimidazolesuccinocarboxamide synthase [Flavobacterium sp. F372]|jgi:Ca2+/Na+ antiporter|uniref:Phosphoribosylaminoimidazolesuccinocarboxamide synthase n=1 Tax=Flavobacterium bernardetii TaxID=2813823 RepID=A0ABR7J2Z4_9FLAO|nr:phosphoribosylaminoimidazolesuccinocarboxamide synthase [Flavobacterium bernardetii]MBC5836283.1 phosphoribosylaminoimidazolesuccinocarboxamide synthase [Flavobacterium bernardetii]NHF71516.1 phosphoribosylaminoimidazolesuccinocarboxamide synthase [Flavobacterium bernardetii]
MESEKKFKTKTGFCHILPDKIILTRDGIIGNVAEITVGNKISRILIIYTGFAIFLLYFAFTDYQENKIFSTLSYVFFAVYLLFKVKQSMNYSATSTIERNKIKDVKFIDAKYGATRSRFEVIFEDENGKIKTRLILLPGSLNDGENETKKALEIMKTEKIYTYKNNVG